MKKICLNGGLTTAFVFLLSCSFSPKNNSGENGSVWPQLAKDSFMAQCRTTLKASFDSTQAKTICNCILEKMMSKHPDTNEVKKMTAEQVTQESMAMAPQCLFSK